MVKLADTRGEIPLLAKRLRHAELVGDRLPEDLRVRENTRAVRIEPGEKRVPARPAQRISAIGAIEANAARRELVEVRRLRDRVAITPEKVRQIVRQDEQHILALSRRSEGGGEGSEHHPTPEPQPVGKGAREGR